MTTSIPFPIDDGWYTVERSGPTLDDRITSLERSIATLHQTTAAMMSTITVQYRLIEAQRTEMQAQQAEINTLKEQVHTLTATLRKEHKTDALLEELKVLKQRELNLALRCHLPVPFLASAPHISAPFLPTIRSPVLSSAIKKQPQELPGSLAL